MEKSIEQIEKNVSASFGYVKKDMLMLNDAISDIHDKIQHLSLNHAALMEKISKMESKNAVVKTVKPKSVKKKVVKKVKTTKTKSIAKKTSKPKIVKKAVVKKPAVKKAVTPKKVVTETVTYE